MRPRQIVVPLFVPAALALVAACGSSSTPSSPASSAPPTSSAATKAASNSGPQTLNLVERPTSATFTPKGGATVQGGPTRPPQPGDVVAFDAQLTRSGAATGHDHVSFAYQNGGVATVAATVTLSDGTIVVRGTAPVTESLTLPIISGTGAYAGRTGTLTAKHVSQQEDDLTVALT